MPKNPTVASLSKVLEVSNNFVQPSNYNCYEVNPTITTSKVFGFIKEGTSSDLIVSSLLTNKITYTYQCVNDTVSIIIIPNLKITDLGFDDGFKIRAVYVAIKNNIVVQIRLDLLHIPKPNYHYLKYILHELPETNEYFYLSSFMGVGCTHYGSIIIGRLQESLRIDYSLVIVDEDSLFGDYLYCNCP